MRNTSKIKNLSEKFPIWAVEHNCIISKDADITIAFRVDLPELFTVTSKEYEAIHSAWHLAQGIVNTTKEIIETSATATNMINNFKETVKIYEQGKKYYDKLKKVNNLVKDARKVRKAILMVGEVSDIYVNNYQKMLYDENYTPQELTAIASGYAKLLEESADLLKELRKIVNPTTLSLNDKERMDMVERFYSQIKEYRDLVQYFTNKNISVSYLRAKKKGSASKVVALYGTASERNW